MVYRVDVSKGNSVVNANNIGKQTKEISVSDSDVSIISAQTKSSSDLKAIFSEDSLGKQHCRIYGSITFTAGSSAATSVNITDLEVRDQTAVNKWAGCVASADNGERADAAFVQETNLIYIGAISTSRTARIIDFSFPIDHIPSWVTADDWEDANVKVHIPEATPTDAGIVKKNKTQERVLLTDITAASEDITDLKFSNLDTTKWYRLSGNLMLTRVSTSTNTKDIELYSYNSTGARTAANTVGKFRYRDNAAGDVASTRAVNLVFKATASDLKFAVDSTISNMRLEGDASGTKDLASFLTIEELNNYEVTTDFTP